MLGFGQMFFYQTRLTNNEFCFIIVGVHIKYLLERSHSGLVRWFRKPVCPQGYRGFDSLPLRQRITYEKRFGLCNNIRHGWCGGR